MGKKQHQSDKLYLTNKEWKHEWGGRKEAALQQLSRLPFSCCALSLTPFTDPVMSPDGTIFELLNIIPYIKEHGVNPVTGQPLSIKQLTKLVFHKNPSGDYHCPVTFKVFNDHSHIVAIRTSGNVYSYEAVDQLNVKAKNMTDLLSGEAFSKADIVTVQDPADWSRRQIDLFEHIRRKRAQIDGGDADVATSTAQSSTAAAAAAPAENQAEAFTGKRLPKPAAEDERDPKRTKAAPIQLAPARAHFTTGAAAASFTSTAQVLVTTNQSRALDEEEIREKRYTNIRRAALTRKGQADQTSMKAFVRLNTNLGALNLRLDCDFAPRTCHNFLALCEKGYYNGVKFHRLISNFMIQGGDPTGTGRGGESAWGGKIKDEFHDKLRHDERGVLSMANSGPDTNGSQFFITFAPCTHLDNKHSVFGHVVGGSDVLSAMEREPVGDRDMPRRDLIIQDAVVYTNPFSQPDEAEAKELRRLELERLDAQPVETYGSTISISGQEIHRQGVGKYISASSVVQVSAADAQAKERAEKLKLEQAKAAAEQQQQTSDGADGAKKQRFSFKSFA